MFNPFALLTTPLLNAFIRAGKTIFVRQTFRRGLFHAGDDVKGAYIFTHYNDIGHAEFHYGAINHDSGKFLYQWDDLLQRRKLQVAAANPAGFRIYSTVFENDWENHITDPLKERVKRYVESDLGWRPSRADTVIFDIYVTYGELYVRIRLRGQQVRVKLSDIEKEKDYVL